MMPPAPARRELLRKPYRGNPTSENLLKAKFGEQPFYKVG
jgi:hypothetical protein